MSETYNGRIVSPAVFLVMDSGETTPLNPSGVAITGESDIYNGKVIQPILFLVIGDDGQLRPATSDDFGGSGEATSVSWASITGKPPVIAAGADQAAARTAIGAGTSNLALGTTAATAKAGNYVPSWAEVTGKPTTFAPTAATLSAIGGVKQAAHVDPATATVADVVNALIAAGTMA